jgi:hypothetical protein
VEQLPHRFLYLTLGAVLVGCYSLQPPRGAALEPGAQVAFDVTDVGRVALGGSMGPEIAQVEGRLVEEVNGDYRLSVSNVRLLRGGTQVWNGERVVISKQHIGRTYERRFSKGRTIALSLAIVAGTVIVMNKDLNVFLPRENRPDPIDTIGTFRIPIRPARP